MGYIQSIANSGNDDVAFQFGWLNGLAEVSGRQIVLQLGTGNITIGNYNGGLIDMADIAQFPASIQAGGFGGTQTSTFGHELFEQMYKQSWGLGSADFMTAHQYAVRMESELAGAWRGGSSMNGSSLNVTWYSGVRVSVQHIDFSAPGVVSGVHF